MGYARLPRGRQGWRWEWGNGSGGRGRYTIFTVGERRRRDCWWGKEEDQEEFDEKGTDVIISVEVNGRGVGLIMDVLRNDIRGSN